MNLRPVALQTGLLLMFSLLFLLFAPTACANKTTNNATNDATATDNAANNGGNGSNGSNLDNRTSPTALLEPPPVARRVPHSTTIHGVTLQDDYYWLRDDEHDPSVRAYLEAENLYTSAAMAHTRGLQDTLYKEFIGHLKETDVDVPVLHGGFWYYTRTEQDRQYPLHCRRAGTMDAPEQLLLDENVEAGDGEYFALGTFDPSPDHKLIAWSCDTSGAEQFTIRVRAVAPDAPREDLPDAIENSSGSVAWASDNRTFFYSTLDDTNRPYRLWRHTLGTAQADDVMVYEETDAAYYLGIARSRSGRFIIMTLESQISTEVHVLEAADAAGEFRLIEPRRTGIEYAIEHHGDRFFIVTNDNAVNFRLVEAPVNEPGKANWKDVIPHRADAYIQGVDAFAHHLVVSGREKGLPTLQVRNLDTGESHTVAFLEAAYRIEPVANPEFDTTTFRFGYASLVTPWSTFAYNMTTRARELLKEREVPGYDRKLYETARIAARARDGVEVPISLVYRKGLKKDGTNPCLLYGYGSYGSTDEDPWFSSSRLSLLDRGFVFAIAHVRGGGEMGRMWYENGKLLKKKNTFTDFIACAEHLIAEGYTTSSRLAITG
ncbi:MAG: S9 family peptidase, partial [Planctomycetota bacterium]